MRAPWSTQCPVAELNANGDCIHQHSLDAAIFATIYRRTAPEGALVAPWLNLTKREERRRLEAMTISTVAADK
jgi:hypothetical protein